MIDLHKTALEIREILDKVQKERCIEFVESTHSYSMKNEKGIIVDNYPSVSSVHEHFYLPFDEKAKSLSMCNGDKKKQKILLKEWSDKGVYASNMGSRVHYELELDAIARYGNYKSVREPEFVCNEEQIAKGDMMIKAGKKYLDLMINERQAVLLDTETTMGSNTLRYFGTPDKIWLVLNKPRTRFYFYITDWKTNKPENFVPKRYHEPMYPPFDMYPATTLQHYYVQLPLYARLLIDMLRGTKYENIELGACLIVLLKDDGTYQEFRVPTEFPDNILHMNLDPYIKLKKK